MILDPDRAQVRQHLDIRRKIAAKNRGVGSTERRLVASGVIRPRKISDAYLEKLIERYGTAHHMAVVAGPADGTLALRRSTTARARIRNALLQREREIAAHLGRCSRCGVRALIGSFEWPDMGGRYGNCIGCGSTVRVLEDDPPEAA